MSLIRRVSSILTYKKIITLPCPQQTNNYDCGVFAMYFLEEVFKYRKMCSSTCLEDGLSLNTNFDATVYRWKILCKVCNFLKPKSCDLLVSNDSPCSKNISYPSSKQITISKTSDISLGTKLKKSASMKPLKNVVRIFGDSHGRDSVDNLNRSELEKTTSGFIMPSAKFNPIVNNIKSGTRDLSNNDHVVIVGGANDVYCNQAGSFLKSMLSLLQVLNFTNVLISTIPIRYDLPEWSCVNEEIRKTNSRIKQYRGRMQNVKVIDLTDLKREHFTRHGLHLNWRGKKRMTDKIKTILDEKGNNTVIELQYDLSHRGN
ncbi:uncharacterized protein LOC120354342 [Nilaparvata lugens]|uniref:uncharacterized protein LOC120354342 n=1 Tax=Nilaparvata lugens TaxID=108931 RepID=UPI00193E7DCA|nr:uncharacterized protein LOC120354342 [Nilaparvata lugens]